MRTPRFELSQDSDYLFIRIHAPYCNLKDLEVDIDNFTFMFYCKPFFLRLNLPGAVKETDSSNGQFLADTQDFLFKVEKVEKVEFTGLDLVSKLLQPANAEKQVKLAQIEVLGEESLSEEIEEDAEWYLEQEQQVPTSGIVKTGYGFGNSITDYLESVQETLGDILDDVKLIEMTVEERKQRRIEIENSAFDSDIYLYQFFNDEDVQLLLDCKSKWIVGDKFSDAEIDILKELPTKREYLIQSEAEHMEILLGLVDILFCYCYDQRIFMFEPSCESGWAINKISPTLSSFDKFSTPKEVIVACFRRALIFPLHRNFKLNLKILEDFLELFETDNCHKIALHCLLDIYQIFNRSSNTHPTYILNQLYIQHYLIYIQQQHTQFNLKFKNIIQQIRELQIEKTDLNLDLSKIEAQAIGELMSSSDQSSSDESDESDSEELDSDDDIELSVKLNKNLTIK